MDPQIWDMARQFQEGSLPQAQSSSFSVAYTVKNQDGAILVQELRPLDTPNYTFMAPSSASGIEIEAQLVENNQLIGTANRIALALGTPKPAEPAVVAEPDFVRLSSGQVVNVRSGPSTQYPVIGQLQAGVVYRVLGKNSGGDWWQFDFDGTVGWTIGSLVNAQGDTGSLAVINDIPAPPQLQTVAVAAAPAPAPAPAVEEKKAEAAPAPAPAPAPAVVNAPAPSGGGAFGYGVQAHMVHNDQAGMVMQVTTGMGFNWVKQQVEWKVFEPDPGDFQWGALDGIVNAANGSGVNLLFSVVNAPSWAREPGFDGSVGGPPQDPQTFANFLRRAGRQILWLCRESAGSLERTKSAL